MSALRSVQLSTIRTRPSPARTVSTVCSTLCPVVFDQSPIRGISSRGTRSNASTVHPAP